MHSIIFFGTDEFASYILETLIENGANVKAIVTKQDKPKSRNKKLLPPVVKKTMIEKGWDIPLYQPAKASTSEFAETLREYKPDLFVVVSYGEIISQELLDIPKLLPVNIHPSFLPRYRGASPLRTAMLNGDKEIGIAVIEMVKAMDAGDIVKFDTLEVLEEENHSMLEKRMFKKAGEVLQSLLKDFEVKRVQKKAQVGKPTFTKKIKKEDLLIDWSAPCDQIVHKIQAYGATPGALCYVQNKEKRSPLKLIRAVKLEENSTGKLETLTFSKGDGWAISCKDGVLKVLEVQPENKKVMDVKDYINGLRGLAPELLKS